jgi:hypothetical protein
MLNKVDAFIAVKPSSDRNRKKICALVAQPSISGIG